MKAVISISAAGESGSVVLVSRLPVAPPTASSSIVTVSLPSTGGSLTGVMVRLTVPVSVAVPSETV